MGVSLYTFQLCLVLGAYLNKGSTLSQHVRAVTDGDSRGSELLPFPALTILGGILEHAQVQALIRCQEGQGLAADDKLCGADVCIVEVLGQQGELLALRPQPAEELIWTCVSAECSDGCSGRLALSQSRECWMCYTKSCMDFSFSCQHTS